MNIESTISQIENTCNSLSSWKESHFTDALRPIFDLQRDLRSRMARFAEAQQTLSIGIIGQVKAGKSSFLNALLFDGQHVLPEAATPKTANLTRISWGPAAALEVIYYSPEEWAELEEEASSEADHEEAKVARELIRLAADNHLDVATILAKGSEHLEADGVDGLKGLLNQYSGEDGRYTALVKTTHLFLPREELKGFDVVDTPGMNDPVVSRTQKTREYMANCDVVFFLSRCSQFLDQPDLDLLARQLPGKGVKRLVLVAGQFDSALLDDGFDRDSLAATEANLKQRLSKRAAAELEKLAAQREQAGEGYEAVAAMLRSIKSPIFASTFAHGFGSWSRDQWSSSMKHVYEELSDMAARCWIPSAVTTEEWLRIGNFSALQGAFDAAFRDKQQLLQAQREGLVPEARRNFMSLLRQLQENVRERRRQLQEGDLAQLEAESLACETRIESISGNLGAVIDDMIQRARNAQEKLSSELHAHIKESRHLRVREGTEDVQQSYEVSNSTWYKPWTWGSTRTVCYTTSRSYQYLASADVLEQLERYQKDSSRRLEATFESLTKARDLQARLRDSLLDTLEEVDGAYDPASVRSTLAAVIERTPLPTLELQLPDTSRAVSKRVGKEARTPEEMTKLQNALDDALSATLGNLLNAFQNACEDLETRLTRIRKSLAKDFTAALQRQRRELMEAFKDKAGELQRCEDIIVITEAVLEEAGA